MPLENASNSIELRSEEVQELLSDVPNWMILWGNTLIFGLMILLLAIGYWVKYPDVLSAKALVTTTLPPQQVQAQVSGKLEALLVADRQVVAAHTVLAIIENTAHFEDVFHLKEILDTIKIDVEQFSFPFKSLGTLELGEITPAFLLFKNNYRQYQLNRELQPLVLDAQGPASTLKELQTRLGQLEKQKQLGATELKLTSKKVWRDSLLLLDGALAMQEFEQSQLNLLQVERSLNNTKLSISQTKEQLELTSLSLKKNSIFQTQEQSLLTNQLIEAILQLKTAVKNWEIKYVVRSNITGQLSYIRPWTNHEIVNAGEPLFTIIPGTRNTFVAQLQTPAQNVGKVKHGQNVLIQLDHFPSAEFGVLQGSVQSVALSSDDEGNYYVEVILPEGLRTSYQKEIVFQRELSGTAEIVTEDLRLLQRLFYQFRNLLN